MSKRCCNMFAACHVDVVVYWQCPDRACRFELAFCKSHGGNERAQDQMREHIAEHRKEAA